MVSFVSMLAICASVSKKGAKLGWTSSFNLQLPVEETRSPGFATFLEDLAAIIAKVIDIVCCRRVPNAWLC